MIPKITYHKKQLQAFNALQNPDIEEVCFGGAKMGGKSFLGCSHIGSHALLYPDTKYFIARAQLSDLVKFTIPSFYEFFEVIGLKVEDYFNFNGQYNYFDFKNGSKVLLIECSKKPSDPLFERFGSMQMTKGWCEEAGEIHELAYENLKLSLGRWKNKEYNLSNNMLITCNPKKGWLFDNFYYPDKMGTLPKNKVFIKSLVTDNDFRSESTLKAMDNIKDPIAYKRLRLGDWEYEDNENCLCSYEKIEDLFKNDHVTIGRRYIVCDAAREGKDPAVIMVLEGGQILDIITIPTCKIDELELRLRELRYLYKVAPSNVIVDGDGLGAGIPDHLGCKSFSARKKTIYVKRNNYASLKDACGYILADKINNGEIWIKTKNLDLIYQIKREIEQLKFWNSDNDGAKQIMPKPEIKKFIGNSPNYLDCLIMSCYWDQETL